jgi:hypothetical protein
MEAAMLLAGVGILMKIIVVPPQVFMNGIMFPGVIIGKGGRADHQ